MQLTISGLRRVWRRVEDGWVWRNVGDALPYKILMDDTKKIIYRSAVRPRDDNDPNNHLETFGGVGADKPIKSV